MGRRRWGRRFASHRVVASHMVYETLSGAASLDGRADFQSTEIERLFGLPVVNGATGWNRALWLALGGNDESMRTTGEDFDMALRAHLEAGVEPYFAEDAVYNCRRRTGSEGDVPSGENATAGPTWSSTAGSVVGGSIVGASFGALSPPGTGS